MTISMCQRWMWFFFFFLFGWNYSKLNRREFKSHISKKLSLSYWKLEPGSSHTAHKDANNWPSNSHNSLPPHSPCPKFWWPPSMAMRPGWWEDHSPAHREPGSWVCDAQVLRVEGCLSDPSRSCLPSDLAGWSTTCCSTPTWTARSTSSGSTSRWAACGPPSLTVSTSSTVRSPTASLITVQALNKRLPDDSGGDAAQWEFVSPSEALLGFQKGSKEGGLTRLGCQAWQDGGEAKNPRSARGREYRANTPPIPDPLAPPWTSWGRWALSFIFFLSVSQIPWSQDGLIRYRQANSTIQYQFTFQENSGESLPSPEYLCHF